MFPMIFTNILKDTTSSYQLWNVTNIHIKSFQQALPPSLKVTICMLRYHSCTAKLIVKVPLLSC